MRRFVVAALLAPAVWFAPSAGAGAQTPTCEPGGEPVELTGRVAAADAKSYRELPFAVGEGTTRIEVVYDWTDADGDTVLDLGLWDADGFRGWSGSREGRVAGGQEAVFVQPDEAARGYVPGPIGAGEWFVDLGIATVSDGGAEWTVTVTCSDPPVGPAFVPDPVDPTHVADPDPGWYHGDFHMHGEHSHPRAPDFQAIVDTARAEGLDFLPITEYVTGQHWDELGALQRANPDVVVWPGREIITYFGHATVFGETRSVLEYRHGHDGVSLRDIQERSLADGALFGIAHPEFFPGPLADFCRGCYFQLDDAVDLSRVDTMEVLTGPVLFGPTDIGLPPGGELLANPFTAAAIERWESLLLAGHRITAVSGSDSKGYEDEPERRGYGSSATAVYAQELSRAGIAAAVRAGRAYVQTHGVDESPTIELTAVAPGGATAMIGDTLAADSATMTVTVRGGSGQTLLLSRDGAPYGAPVPIDADPFTYTWEASRVAGSGPLGTFWRVDVADDRSLTVISNPIFLAGPSPSGPPAGGTGGQPAGELPRTGTGVLPIVAAAVALVAGGGVLVGRRRRPSTGS